MPIDPPEIEFVTTTRDSVSVDLTPPPATPTFDHILVFVYDYLTNAQVHVSAPIFGLTYTVPGLEEGRIYIVSAIAVDTSGDYSAPAELLVVATTNDHDPDGQIPAPKVVIVDVVQESRSKVYVEYRLEDSKEIYGELTMAEYSFNGTFTDAVPMKEAYGDARHDGRFGLQFDEAGSIVDPHHIFIWDISEIPDFEVHDYAIRLQGKSGAVYSVPAIKSDVSLNTTPLSNRPVPVIVTGDSFDFTFPLFFGKDPLTGATVSIDEIRDDTDTDVLGGAVAVPEIGATGVYQVSVALPYPAGRYRVFYSATAPDYALSERREIIIASTDYQAIGELNHPSLCLVYGKLIDNLGRALSGIEVKAYYKREPSRFDRVAVEPVIVETDEFGFFALHLLRNTEVQLHITELQYDELLKIPDAFVAEFTSIQFNQPSALSRGDFGHVLPIDLQ